MQGKIILAFFGSGKTYINKNYPNFLDLESHYFKGDLEMLISAIKDASQVYGYNVLTSCRKRIIELLKEKELDFIVVLPTKNQKEEYVRRYKERGTIPVVLKDLEENFDNYIDEVMVCDCKKVILKEGQYLSDVIGFII